LATRAHGHHHHHHHLIIINIIIIIIIIITRWVETRLIQRYVLQSSSLDLQISSGRQVSPKILEYLRCGSEKHVLIARSLHLSHPNTRSA